MLKRNNVRLCALLGASGLAFAAQPALAEQAEGASDAAGDPIVVTGSRVRGSGPVGSAVIALDRDQLLDTGQPTVDRMIKELPQNFDLGVSENSRGQSGGAANIVYANSVNIHGIGPYATLVLVDGHRVTNNTRSTDPSIIPSLALERVEVIADGASAIYGSDAIAGVVNLIPRRDLDGVEMAARHGFADAGGFSESMVGLAAGKVWDRGQIMLAYEHVDRSNLSGDDRDFYTSDQRLSGGGDYRVTRCNPGTLRIGSTTYAIPQTGLTQENSGLLVAGTTNLCDEFVRQDLIPETSYNTLASTFSYQITDSITFFGDAFYNKRKFLRNPPPINGTITVPSTNAFFVRPAGFTGSSYQIDYNFIDDLPLNQADGSSESWQVTPGLRARLPANWQAELVASHGITQDHANQTRRLNTPALNAALASSDPATAFDPYGLGRTSGAVRAAISDQVFRTPTRGRLTSYEARLNGPLVELPGGEVVLATGFERQDSRVELGTQIGSPTSPMATRTFDRKVNSVYAELQIPIFGSGNAVTGFERLIANAAVRYDDYSDVGSTTNSKFGLSWEPVNDLKLRASYGTSFRAPLITQIYGNSNILGVSTYQNPLGGTIQGVSRTGANTSIEPETASSWSIGGDWVPAAGLRLSISYFNVKYEGQIESPSGNNALAREADFAGTGIILRGQAARDAVLAALAEGAAAPNAPYPGGSIDNVNLFVDLRNFNLGTSKTSGIDFQGQYRVETGSAGALTFGINGTYLTNFKVAQTPTAALVDRRNTIFYPMKLKVRGSAAWDVGPVQAFANVTYFGGYENNVVNPSERVSNYVPVDFGLTFDLDALVSTPLLNDLRVGVEARNVFDEQPPYVNVAPSLNGSGGYDATVTNPIGRVFAISLRAKM